MDRRMLSSALVVVAVALLGGCDTEPDRSVEWYLANPEAHKAKLKECSEQGRLRSGSSDNCARAFKAGLIDRPSGSTP